jgi:hypothetical protein
LWSILFGPHPGLSTACLSCNAFVVVTCVMSKIFKARTEGALSTISKTTGQGGCNVHYVDKGPQD